MLCPLCSSHLLHLFFRLLTSLRRSCVPPLLSRWLLSSFQTSRCLCLLHHHHCLEYHHFRQCPQNQNPALHYPFRYPPLPLRPPDPHHQTQQTSHQVECLPQASLCTIHQCLQILPSMFLAAVCVSAWVVRSTLSHCLYQSLSPWLFSSTRLEIRMAAPLALFERLFRSVGTFVVTSSSLYKRPPGAQSCGAVTCLKARFISSYATFNSLSKICGGSSGASFSDPS